MASYLPDDVREDILKLARKHGIQRVLLYGSRARGTNAPHSDVDLAISGGDTTSFAVEIDDFARTLLMFDVVDMDNPMSAAFRQNILNEGVELYGGT